MAASAALLGLWRTWPLWHGSECEGGALGARWQALAQQDAQAWVVAALMLLGCCAMALDE